MFLFLLVCFSGAAAGFGVVAAGMDFAEGNTVVGDWLIIGRTRGDRVHFVNAPGNFIRQDEDIGLLGKFRIPFVRRIVDIGLNADFGSFVLSAVEIESRRRQS